MPRKAILVADPGIDTAFAIATALFDPEIDVVALAATPGNVSAVQATRNVQVVLDQCDPPRRPRLGGALPVSYDTDGTRLHGPGGLGGISWQCSELHHLQPADKIIVDQVRQHPDEISLVCLGPLTTLARSLDRDPMLPKLLRQIIVVGGTWQEPGNASAVAEFHFYCDPPAARQVLRCGVPIVMLPLDVTRKALFAPAELVNFAPAETRAGQFLGKIANFGINASARMYGIEGFHLKDVLGVCALALFSAFKTHPSTVDVEVSGELTRGMSVIDRRAERAPPNVDLVTDVDMNAVRDYLKRVFRLANS